MTSSAISRDSSALDAGTLGVVEHLHVAEEAGAPMVARDRVTALAGIGLEGDRYAARRGHWSPIARRGDQLTLVEAEVVESLHASGFALAPGATRRNVTTRGVGLDELIGRRFRVGGALLVGVRRCEPCSYLEGLLDLPVMIPLVHRAGIRAEVVEGGEIAVGDPIRVDE
jgi:MOSC domain-containing protein YiiM